MLLQPPSFPRTNLRHSSRTIVIPAREPESSRAVAVVSLPTDNLAQAHSAQSSSHAPLAECTKLTQVYAYLIN